MSGDEPVEPVPAATILLCRDTAEGVETFMVVRHHQIDFASGALVFPGGKADPEDSAPALLERCEDGIDDGMLTLRVAAVREVFEECGVLFAKEAATGEMITGERLESLEASRDALNKHETGLLEIVEKEDLILACDELHRFAHWITPEMMPKRFDTHFFVAHAPADHVALHDGTESVDSVWITAERVLREADEGKWQVIFPTRCNLQLLAQSGTTDAAIAAAAAREMVPVTPHIDPREDGNYLVIPTEAGYPISEVLYKGGGPP